ncbi:MAG: broad specificity phosphatase PhoE [Arenicella sp.]|jgi:broad specificity phosphatase PhoE
MTTLYLIRHGQASFGQENYDQLSELGQQQATHMGNVLAKRVPNFDAVCLGTMLRHQQTASNCLEGFEKVSAQTDLASDAVFDAGWNEYDHQDILRQYRPEFITSKSMMEYISQQADPKQAFEADFNGAINRWIAGEHDRDYVETWRAFTSRVHQALKTTLASNADKKRIAVFTSGGPISLITQHLLGVPEEKIMQMNWTLLNCGVTKVVSTGSRLFVASLNEHTHFEAAEHKHFITYT